MEGLEVGLFFGGKREGWGVSFWCFLLLGKDTMMVTRLGG